MDNIPSIGVSELEAQERYNDKYVILYDFSDLGRFNPTQPTSSYTTIRG